MTDPRVTLKKLIEDSWSLGDLPVKVSTEWYDAKEEMPQVTVGHTLTTPEYIGLSDDIRNALRRYRCVYTLDAWVKGSQEIRYRVVQEIKRIIGFHCNVAGGNLEFLEVSDWRDLDEPTYAPRLLRSQVRVEVLYYE